MAVDLNWLFARKDVFPSWWANAIQQALTSVNTLQISRKSATVIQVVPHPLLGVAGVIIDGKWRMNEATVERTVSGAKGTYSVWAVAKKNEVDNSPAVFTDHTVYTWDLRVTSGAAPTGEGIDITQKIGEVDWSGSAIETIRQTYGSVSGAQIETGALSSESGSDIAWTRDAGGGLLAQYKPGSVGLADLAASAKPVTWYTPKVISTEQSRESTAYATLTTADEIQGVVLPENGLIVIGYQATWKSSVGNGGRAAIFIGPNQLKRASGESADPAAQLAVGAAAGVFTPLFSHGGGLQNTGVSTAYNGDVATGQVLGGLLSGGTVMAGPCFVFAAAGTYNISVQFKAESGSVTAKNRKLWVAVLGA
jgi:hypothetical protein